MANINFTLNGNPVSIDVDKDEELLWVLRDRLDVHGLKYGCGMGLCGACTIHLNGEAIRSCVTPLSAVAGKLQRSRQADAAVGSGDQSSLALKRGHLG